jgi:hypothetical protein
MNKKQMAVMERLFKEQLAKEGKDPEHPSVRAFIRSERKKMKRLKHAGVLK